ncbi:hypothetical protein POM88_020270 [Heracleum sosnowskyi]|uniref:CCHC-type domain-containing protein n=1 Tax=Heracleum sosnowskyi TaxID=360622 RepID=A0AAD8IBL2_9APIA|nr:hypothetical protein POM88_020270 [Heracleum sosnowskyi]
MVSLKDSELENLTSVHETESKERQHVVSKLKSVIVENERLKNDNSKLSSEIIDQDNFLNDKINVLLKEKENLEIVIRQFTKSSTILENMVFNSKESFNREGLGYNANAPLKKEVKNPTPPKNASPKSPNPNCSYCNRSGHISIYCKAEECEFKGKYKWIPKGEISKKFDDKKVGKKKIVNATKKQPKFHYH